MSPIMPTYPHEGTPVTVLAEHLDITTVRVEPGFRCLSVHVDGIPRPDSQPAEPAVRREQLFARYEQAVAVACSQPGWRVMSHEITITTERWVEARVELYIVIEKA